MQTKLEKLIARQNSIREAIRGERHRSRERKKKTLYITLKRLGLLDLTDDQVEAALRAYSADRGTSNGGDQP